MNSATNLSSPARRQAREGDPGRRTNSNLFTQIILSLGFVPRAELDQAIVEREAWKLAATMSLELLDAFEREQR